MKKKATALLFLTWINFIKKCPPLLRDIASISFAQGYLRVLKVFRAFLVFQTQTALSICLLMCGVIIIHISLLLGLFLLVPWSSLIKIFVIFLLGSLEVCASWLCLRRLFLEKEWLEAGKINPFLEEALKRNS